MKRLLVLAAAAATLSAAIPAEAASTCCAAGTSGRGGSLTGKPNCLVVPTSKICRTLAAWR